MKKLWSLFALLLFFSRACLAAPTVYELVRADGYILARTEAKPSVGDTYWDATTDIWYTVISVRGTQALAVTETEAGSYFRARNLRYAAGAVLFLTAAYWLRRRCKRPSGAPER